MLDLEESSKTKEEFIKIYGEKLYSKLSLFDEIYEMRCIIERSMQDFVENKDKGVVEYCGIKGKSATLFQFNHKRKTYKKLVHSRENGLIMSLIGSKRYGIYGFVDYNINEVDHKLGLVNKKGKLIAKAKYNGIVPIIIDGIVYANKYTKLGDISGIINNQRQFKDMKMYDDFEVFSKDLIKVTKNYLSGIVNENKEVVVPMHYNIGDLAVESSDAGYIILVKDNNFWFAYDKLFNLILDEGFRTKENAVSAINDLYASFINGIDE